MAADVSEPDRPGLEDTEWRIEDIVGRPIEPHAPATLRFEANGRVSGRTGCNLFTGAVTLDADSIHFEGLALTKMHCPPALMDQEQRLVLALKGARRYSVDPNGQLHLEGEYEPFLLRATRV